MKKIIQKIKCWIFIQWCKRKVKSAQKNETFNDQEKKQVIKEFNEDRMKREILDKSVSHSNATCSMPTSNLRTCEMPFQKINSSHELQKAYDQKPPILSVTVRSEKPVYNNVKTEKYVYNDKTYSLTKKSLFFIQRAVAQKTKGPIDFQKVCHEFLEQKYPDKWEFDMLSKEKFKPKYHKKTIRHLEAVKIIECRAKKWYLVQ